jgi:hypothetical protein
MEFYWYVASVQVQCIKQHECVECGGRFSYPFERTVTSRKSYLQQWANARAKRMAADVLANEVDSHPCPHCGVFQPEMIAVHRARRHGWGLKIGLAVLGFLLLAGMSGSIPYSATSRIGAGLAGLLLTCHLAVVWWNPNGDLDKNRQTADRNIKAGRLGMEAPGTQPTHLGHSSVTGWSIGQIVGLLLLTACVAAYSWPEISRVRNGWVMNPDWRPMVAGPGDTTEFRFPEEFSSLSGRWTGEASAIVLNAKELGLSTDRLTATTRQDKWGDSIDTRYGDKGSAVTPWAKVKLPASPDFSGKTLDRELSIEVTYPVVSELQQFENQQQSFTIRSPLHISTPVAAAAHRQAWLIGQLTGLGLYLVGSLALCTSGWALRKRGKPHTVAPIPKA